MLDWIKHLITRPDTGDTKSPNKKGRKTSRNAISEAFAKLREENTKRDALISKTTERSNYHSVVLKSHSKNIAYLEKEILKLSHAVSKLSATPQTLSPTPLPPSATAPTASPTSVGDGRYVELESLTHLQQATLFVLAQLMARENTKWVGMKTLVQNLYPGSEYNKVRTTIFEYVRILEELGLTTRSKRGNLTFLSVTPKGMEIINRKNAKKKEKLVKLVEERP